MECTIDGCDRPIKAIGLCSAHCNRHYRRQNMVIETVCVIEGCYNETGHGKRRRCTDHAKRCTHPGCTKWAKTLLCRKHQNRKYGQTSLDMDAPEYGFDGAGQWHRMEDGYVIRYQRNAEGKTVRVRQHREVMAEHLGRPLLRHENVHHINGVRHDNRIENLELWITSQPSGQRMTDVVAWAQEILETYNAEAEQEARRLNR